MDDPIHILPAYYDDAVGIAKVDVDAWRSAYAGILPDAVLLGLSEVRQTRVWQRRIEACGEDAKIWQYPFVAKDINETVLGYGYGGLSRDQELNYEAEVFCLYVDPAWLSVGIGGDLLDHMFFEMREGDIGSVVIWSLADSPYRHFYHAYGGKIIAERHSKYWGKPLREVAYGWPNLAAWCDHKSTKGSFLSS